MCVSYPVASQKESKCPSALCNCHTPWRSFSGSSHTFWPHCVEANCRCPHGRMRCHRSGGALAFAASKLCSRCERAHRPTSPNRSPQFDPASQNRKRKCRFERGKKRRSQSCSKSGTRLCSIHQDSKSASSCRPAAVCCTLWRWATRSLKATRSESCWPTRWEWWRIRRVCCYAISIIY